MRDGYTATLDAKLTDEVDWVSKMLGVKTQFVDAVDGGIANAKIQDGVISIEKNNQNPVRFLLGHEITHRIQELSPESYRVFRDAALTEMGGVTERVAGQQSIYAKAGMNLSSESAMDELAADYAGRLMEDGKVMGRFLENHKSNRTLLERVRDVFHTLAEKLTGLRKRQVQSAEALLSRALEDAARTVEKGTKNAATEGGEGKYSLNPDFGRQFDQWMEKDAKERTQSSGRFLVGATSEALQSIGVSDYKIYWWKKKLLSIMDKHPGMTAEVIKSVPNVLEHPILVMQSQTVLNRVTLFGETVDMDGMPVLVAVELSPQNKTGEVMDYGVIASAYGKNNAQQLIDQSKILYVEPNKKRTNQWLHVLRLQLPSSVTTYGSIHSISTFKRNVNGDIVVGEQGGKTAMQAAFERAQGEKKAATEGGGELQGQQGRDTMGQMSIKEARDNGGIGEGQTGPGAYGGLHRLGDGSGAFRRKSEADYKFHERVSREELHSRRIAGNEYWSKRAESVSEAARQTSDVLRELGCEHEVIDGYVYHRDGQETVETRGAAVTLPDGTVLINNGIDSKRAGAHTAHHELLHSRYNRGIPDADYFLQVGVRNIELSGKDTNKLVSRIVRDYFDSDEGKAFDRMDYLFEEFMAFVSGEIAEPKMGYDLRSMFTDFEAVKAAWDSMVRNAKNEAGERTSGKLSLKGANDYNALVEQYGAIEPGEKPARDVQVPKKTGQNAKVSQTVRTVLEAGATPEAAVPTIQELVTEGDFSYTPYRMKR